MRLKTRFYSIHPLNWISNLNLRYQNHSLNSKVSKTILKSIFHAHSAKYMIFLFYFRSTDSKMKHLQTAAMNNRSDFVSSQNKRKSFCHWQGTELSPQHLLKNPDHRSEHPHLSPKSNSQLITKTQLLTANNHTIEAGTHLFHLSSFLCISIILRSSLRDCLGNSLKSLM